MAGHNFKHLFTPLKVGNVTVKNRIISTGHDTSLSNGGAINDRLLAYQKARAEGGCGLIVLQVASVHENAHYTSHVLMATTDDCIPGYRRMAEMWRAHDCRIFGQLFHPGREMIEGTDGSFPVAYAPSAIPNERLHVMPRPLTRKIIDEIVRGYGEAAARLARGRHRGRRDRRQPRLSALAIPQPARQPARRRLWRQLREPPAFHPRGARVDPRPCRQRLRGRVAHLGRREGCRGPEGVRGARGDPGARSRRRPRLLQRHRRLIGDLRRRGPHRAADDRRERLCRAVRSDREGQRQKTGVRRRPHQPAAARRAGAGLGPGRSLRHDARADLRSGDGTQGRGRTARRCTRLYRLQPSLHRTFPSRLLDLLHPVSRERSRTPVRAAQTRHGAPQGADRRRRARAG